MGFVKGIHHVALKCADVAQFEKAVGFYRDVLGMPVVRQWGEGTGSGAMLDTGSGLMEIFANGEVQLPQGTIRHFALAVENVDEVAQACQAAGYAITTAPKDICIPSEPPFPARMAFCIGPVGEEIEFFCEK